MALLCPTHFSMPTATPVTRLLLEWAGGSAVALDELMPLVYDELRRLAAAYLRRERPDHTLQPTGLVHEAYLRLVDQHHQNWENRRHFFGVAAHLMRLILVDSARRARADKRGGDAKPVALDDLDRIPAGRADALIALDDALTDLAKVDPRKARIIELRYFGGMTINEVAETVGVSTATVERESRIAQLWLSRHMKGDVPE